MRVLLIILSEESELDGGPLPLASFASAYYVFRDASVDLVLTSRLGGYLFLDRSATDAPDVVSPSQRFLADRSAREDLADTICVDDAHAEDFDGAMCMATQGNGAADALPERVLYLISGLLALGKPVVVIPDTLAPATGNGLLITGSNPNSPLLAANALIGALKAAPSTDTSFC